MPLVRTCLALAVAACLGACFIQHPEPIGAAEPAAAGQWSGFWVAEPREAGGEPGFFAVNDVDPAAGSFAVAEADGDGNPIEAPTALLLRRVGDTLFLEAREKEGDPWRLFVVAEMSPDRLLLAWIPRSEAFREAIAAGDLDGSVAAGTLGAPDDVHLSGFSAPQQQKFAAGWQSFFTEERITLRKVPAQ